MTDIKSVFAKKKSKDYDTKTADEIIKELDVEAKEQEKEREKMKEANEKGRKHSTTIDVIKRQVRANPDLRILLCVFVLFAFVGYFFCRIYLGLTTTQIKTEVMDFFYLFITLVGGAYTGYLKLRTKTGSIGKYLQAEQEKKKRDEDKKKFSGLTQRTLVD